jgi:cation diffusion facilitator family transporter
MRPIVIAGTTDPNGHHHVFLAADHQRSERRTWVVIWLCAVMMVAEIVGGLVFGSIALVADGLHMSTHAGALLLAALAYTYARKHAADSRFSFGTGKFGDLAGFASAIILAMIALLIAYEAAQRLISPVAIHFDEAIPIAVLGLLVNAISAWLLSGGHEHHHGHSHGADYGHAHHSEDIRQLAIPSGAVSLEIHEDGVPPRFRLRSDDRMSIDPSALSIETIRPDGSRQAFTLVDRGAFFESAKEIPEPHAFDVKVTIGDQIATETFEEHEHGSESAHRDNNMRAAVVHVLADAAVSVLVIVGLLLARWLGWIWMDPLAGLVGAVVIASWSYGLIRDTAAILLDMNPDRRMADQLRDALESDGDVLDDLHLWRLGPGHLGAIVCIKTTSERGAEFYRSKLARFTALSHLTIEVAQSSR